MEEQSGIGRISSSGPHLDYNKHLTCGGDEEEVETRGLAEMDGVS